MLSEKPVLSFVDFRREERRAALIRMQPEHQAAVSRPDVSLTGAGRKAKDLISLLVSHGARIRRGSAPRRDLARGLHASRASGGRDKPQVGSRSRHPPPP